MNEYKLKQEGTYLTEKDVRGLVHIFRSLEFPDKLIITLNDFWITINIKKKTFSIGRYEG